MARLSRWVAVALALLMLLLLATFAMPVRTWRTGEFPVAPLPLIEGGPRVPLSHRVWIDTDAACGIGRRTDPDDCLAVLLLARSDRAEIAGISTVFGNAALDETDRVARDLVDEMRSAGLGDIPVFRGLEGRAGGPAPAHGALADALQQGPLTLVALGPLTNIVATLQGRPDLRHQVIRLVAVMARRPGHIFHPAEGGGGGVLFGHGPVFRDLNFDLDREAARLLLAMGIPITFVPYEAAREVTVTPGDVDRMHRAGGPARWIAERSRGWLEFWQTEIGVDGFYPFDLLAAQYVLAPDLFDCAWAEALVGRDRRLWNIWFRDPDALLVGPAQVGSEGLQVVYCPATDPDLHRHLIEGLAGPGR